MKQAAWGLIGSVMLVCCPPLWAKESGVVVHITRQKPAVVTVVHRHSGKSSNGEGDERQKASEEHKPSSESTTTSKSQSELETSIDERPMWKLLHQGKIGTLRRAIAKAKKRKPGWRPSADLRSAMAERVTESALRRQREQERWQDIVTLYHAQPARFDCAHAYRRLYVTEAMTRLHQERAAETLYADTVRHCAPKERVAALEHASARLPWKAMAGLLSLWQPPADLDASLRLRLDEVAFRHWVRRGEQEGHPEALARLRAILPRLEGLRRTDVHESMGWMELRYGDAAHALTQFRQARAIEDSDQALKGELLALHAAGQAEAMQALLQQQMPRLERMGALPDLLPLLASVCGEKHNDACQLQALRQIEAFRPLKPGEEEARGWIEYRREHFTQAAKTFERIYRRERLAGAAKGLFLSLMRLGQTQRAVRLADELGGPFQDIVDRGDAERFYMRKLFHAAQARDESFAPELKHLDADYARISFMQRRRGGNTLEPVFNQFLQRKLVFEGGTFKDKRHHIFLRYEPTQLDVGPPILPLGDNFGTNPIVPTPARYPLQTRHTGYEWNIGYRYEDWRSWYFDIGQGFVHGRIRPTIKGHIGVKQQFLAGFIQGELFRQPIRESMLSYVGMNDPFTNNSWGRVTRSGVRLDGYTLTGIPDVGFTYQLRAEWMRGVSVRKNRHLLLNVFLPRHFQWFHGTEWSVGPLFQWEAFANDQGHFMWGHGGYFSPQVNNYVGLNARFISREAQTYNYEFRAFFGVQTYTTETTPLLPLAPDGRNFLGQTVVEKMYQVQGKIVRDLPWNLQIGGSFSWSDAIYRAPAPVLHNNYREFLLSVFLTWQPEERKTTMRSDHPLFGIETLY